MEYLEGGRIGKIGRAGNKVYRPAGGWTPHIHALLEHVRSQGFLRVPKPLGFDLAGREIVSYIAGDVCNYPLSQAVKSTGALISSAKLLRDYHDASASFVNSLKGDETWYLPVREPVEVICHGDFAPYNVVFKEEQAIAMIDFDTAHPGPRVWDIAYALYRFAPLTDPKNIDGFGNVVNKINRSCLFCDAYGLLLEQRGGLIDLVIKRLQTLVDFMLAEAENGNETFKANIAAGHHLLYSGDIVYLQANYNRFQAGLIKPN